MAPSDGYGVAITIAMVKRFSFMVLSSLYDPESGIEPRRARD